MCLADYVSTTFKVTLLLLLASGVFCLESWEKPGCHLVSNRRKMKIPDCVEFDLTTHACRGFCDSYAVPSPVKTLLYNPQHIITSRAECCSIQETIDITHRVLCIGGVQEFTFKSAKTCDCSVCRRG